VNIPLELFKPNYRRSEVYGIGADPDWQRLDPSNVVKVNDLYYVWYTKAPAHENLYQGTIYYAVSRDGYCWTEQGEALSRGEPGAWDNFGVITPYMAIVDGRYYLFYTASHELASEKWTVRGPNNIRQIGVTQSDSPKGPFRRVFNRPVLSPGKAGAWDSYLVDDTHVLYFNRKYYLYFKGGDPKVTSDTTRWGVAVSDNILGPYVKYENNPFIDSGHTVCVWRHGKGIAALVDNAGPQKHTVQYSEDGIHFVKTADIEPLVDVGCGPFDMDAHNGCVLGRGISWGLACAPSDGILHIVRFDVDCMANGDVM